MSNSQGSYRATTENYMKAYDKLPHSARLALQNAVFDWAPQPFYTAWRNGRFKTGEMLAKHIKQIDQNAVNKAKGKRK